MAVRVLHGIIVVGALSCLSGCAVPMAGASAAKGPGPITGTTTGTTAVSATLTGDPAHPGTAAGWVRTELYFGLGPADAAGGIDAAAWQAFLDKEVTPRFPSGLTMLDALGQWQGREQSHPEHLRSKVIVLLYPDDAAARSKIDAIRMAWKAKTGDLSVLRVTQPAEVSF